MERRQPNTPCQHWRSCKLIIDPVLTNGFFKVYRYDGQHFNMPVQDLGVFPVDVVRDPRICRLWRKYEDTDLVVPKFKIDECYVGTVPPKEVTFARLNDNIKEGFLTDMCKKYGGIEEVEIFYNPKSKKHLGLAKVIFDTVKAAKDTVKYLHETSVMGNIIHVEIDPKGENRMRYLQLLISGLYTPWTLPVGINEQTLQSLTDSLPSSKSAHRQDSFFSPASIATPLSMDTAYSSICQDTPGSFGLTPHSQGTPRTPCLSGTPLSQDSCYSSLQATPVLQGEPSSYSVHRLRREVCYRKSSRPHGKWLRSSDFSYLLKRLKPQPTHPLAAQTRTGHRYKLNSWSQNAQFSAGNAVAPSFHISSPGKESGEVLTSTSESLSSSGAAEKDSAASSSPASPGSPRPEAESNSLDSRIEMLLRKCHSPDSSLFNGGSLVAAAHHRASPAPSCLSKYSPASDYFQECTAVGGGSPVDTQHGLEHAALDVPEEDETAQAVASLLRNSQSPSSLLITDGRNSRSDICHVNQPLSTKHLMNTESSSISKQPNVLNEDKGSSDIKQSAALIVGNKISSMPQPPPPFATKPSSLVLPANSNPPVPPFVFPGPLSSNPPPSMPPPSIPPPVPPFPVRLSNGTIPIPPPGWIPPPGGHNGIQMPPPPIPPPPPVLGPPPPMVAPPSMLPPAFPPYPFPMPPAGHFNKVEPQRHGSGPYCGPAWPGLPLPRFNPFVPPPGYVSVKEDPHKVTVDKVMDVIMEELKSIIKRDLTRRMVEVVAFKSFDEWWDSQMCKAKVAVTPVKAANGSVKEKSKPTAALIQITGQCKITQLPSFNVKKKVDNDAKTAEDQESTMSVDDENERHHENTDKRLENDTARCTYEKLQTPEDSGPAQRRRHARPLELDSDGEEDDEDDETLNADEEENTEKEEDTLALENAPEVQWDREEEEEDKEEEEEEEVQKQKDTESEKAIISGTAEEMQLSDDASLLVVESSSSEESEYSSDSDSSHSYSSERSRESSSDYDLSSEEDEGTEVEEEGKEAEKESNIECIVISSDDESVVFEPPATPTAPLTPDVQLEQALQEWSEEDLGVDEAEGLYLTCPDAPNVRDPMMEFQPSEPQDDLRPPSPLGIPVEEPVFDVEMESPEWRRESSEDVENLRPLTPTGSLEDSDTDLLIRNRPTHLTVEEVERPHTPGRGVASLLESDDSLDHLLPLYQENSDPVYQRCPSEPQASYPEYQDTPKTPGREERSIWTFHNSLRVPATPGRAATPSDGSIVLSPPIGSPFPHPSLSNPRYIRTPQTPGRDIVLPQRTVVERRRIRMVATSRRRSSVSPLACDEFLRNSPTMTSSPCSFSDSSAETPDQWISPGPRMRPLQGLENRPELLDEQSHSEKEKGSSRSDWWKWHRRKRRMRQWQRRRSQLRVRTSSFSPSPLRRRSYREERSVLHSVWKEGIDEEDARLLQLTFEKLQQQTNVSRWVCDTLWIPHPFTRLMTEINEEQRCRHRTGCARSEGFYTISKKDKLKYLNNTRPATDLPTTSTQGMPPHTQTSLRAGSDFRSEQRRLLSSFSCDSDLVKFNQLKFRKKRIRFCRSHIHDWGLFALEPIAADEMVIEYVGQTIRQVIADMREKRYEDEGIGSSYLFRVDQDTIIDATKCGNLARFINHSCNPNCYAKIITVESQKKIVIYSRQPIGINEEITYDYKFPIEDEKIPCFCGADSCRGSLN